MNEGNETEFTENEICELNVLLQTMNDAHREEHGQFRRFMQEDSGYCEQNVGFEKQVLILLRKINASIIDREAHGKERRQAQVLNLDFENIFDETQWPQQGYEDDDAYWEVADQLQANHDKYYALLEFVRGETYGHACYKMRGCTTSGKGMCGLGSLVHSLPDQVNLVSLNISQNGITCDDVLGALENGLPNLIELDMSYNDISEEGANAIFDLLADPMCKIQKLDLSHNRHIRSSESVSGHCVYVNERTERDPGQNLVHVLQKQNRSLVALNLSGTGIKASISLVDIFLFHDLRHNTAYFDVLDYVEGRNHHLKVLQVDDNRLYSEKRQRHIMCAVQSAVNMNKDGPQQALETKIYWYFEEQMNKEKFFGEELDTEYAMQCLEFV